MNNAKDVAIMTVKAPTDVRKSLEQWAAENLTSMNAEIVRSVRDRAAREQERAVADVPR